MNKNSSSTGVGPAKQFLALLAVLLLVLGALFARSFLPGMVLYSNDGPLGAISALCNIASPDTARGIWQDLNWLGNEGVSSPPNFTMLLALLIQPLDYAKFAGPIGLLVLGLSAWLFFRQLRLAPIACVAGGVAAALNSDFLSTSAWGIVSQPVCFAANYLALAAMARVTSSSPWRAWARVILAGLAVGMGVMQGWDVGALFSLFVAAFVLYQALFLNEDQPKPATKMGRGVARVVLVAAFAVMIATQTLSSLVGTQIKNVAGMAQDPATRDRRWAEATTWSLPPNEVLQVIIPGVYGYRNSWYMYENSDPKEDQYWGLIGDTMSTTGGGLWRLSGTGLYAGVFVVMVALWGVLQSLRGRASPFTDLQRCAVWFWTGVLVVTTLLAFGRYVPVFYKLFYALPYAPTIRNPTKFMHIFSWALVIVFAYGLHGMFAAYMQNPVARVGGVMAQFKNWRVKASGFDRKWLSGCVIAIGVALLGWLFYASGTSRLQEYVKTVGIPAEMAPAVAQFSVHAVGWFVLLLLVAVGLTALIMTGQFSGRRAGLGGGLIVLLLCLDLGRADQPWIAYWDTAYKYAPDPVVSFLAEKPYEHRVTTVPISWVQAMVQNKVIQFNQAQGDQFNHLFNAYQSDWKQHLFWSNNIQCVDVAQEPRIGQDKIEFLGALRVDAEGRNPPGTMRFWELSNNRYVLGFSGPFVDVLNRAFDSAENRFRIATLPDGRPATFDFVPKEKRTTPSQWPEDYSTVISSNGQLAVIEFTGALPRVSLFANWQVETNNNTVLQTLASPDFNPRQKVLVSDAIPAPPEGNTSQSPGTVSITKYAPRRTEMEAEVSTPAVLLWCDRYNAKWTVTVDGKPAPLLRCNSVERGVYLDPKAIGAGKHTLVFQFSGPIDTFAVSMAAVVLGVILCGLLAVIKEPDAPPAGSGGGEKPRKAPTPGNPAPVETKTGQGTPNGKGKRR